MLQQSRSKLALFASLSLFIGVGHVSAQGDKASGEVRFEGGTKVERDSGVWVDGEYVGPLKDLHGSKAVMLPAGEHQISIRRPGYEDSLAKIVVEPGQIQTVQVNLHASPPEHSADATAALNLNVQPPRAAVLIDDKYVGLGSDFRKRPVQTTPGKHRIKVELRDYRVFNTEVDLSAGQNPEVKVELVKGGRGSVARAPVSN